MSGVEAAPPVYADFRPYGTHGVPLRSAGGLQRCDGRSPCGYLGGRCGYHCSVVFRGRLPHRVSGTGVAWRNRLSLPRPASTTLTSGATPRMSASADWRKRGAENRPYQMCPCGRGRFFCVIFHTYKLTQPSLGCSPGDGCVVISLKWIYLLLRPPCLPEMFRFRSAIFRSEEERNCLSLSSKARSPEGVVSAA